MVVYWVLLASLLLQLYVLIQRPPSRSMSASPRLSSLAPSPSGNQSDSGASRVSFDMTASDDEGRCCLCRVK